MMMKEEETVVEEDDEDEGVSQAWASHDWEGLCAPRPWGSVGAMGKLERSLRFEQECALAIYWGTVGPCGSERALQTQEVLGIPRSRPWK